MLTVLPSAHRMRRSADFTHTVRRGARSGRPRLVVHLVPGPTGSQEPATAGFVVSRAVGRATQRNTVKRRLRHLVAARLRELPGGSRLVVRALPPAAGASSDALGDDLDAALRRVLSRARGTS